MSMLSRAGEKRAWSSVFSLYARSAAGLLGNITAAEACLFFFGAIFSRTTLFGFGVFGIVFIASFAGGREGLTAAWGCTLSSLLYGDFYQAVAALLFAGWTAVNDRILGNLSKRTQARIVFNVIACAVYFLKALTLYDYIIYAAELILANAMITVFLRGYNLCGSLLSVNAGRMPNIGKNRIAQPGKTCRIRFKSIEDLLTIALFCCSTIMGLNRMALPLSLSLIASGLLSAVTGYIGGIGGGAAAGLIAGAAMAGSGSPVGIASSLGILGVVAGIFRFLKRPVIVLAMFMCFVAMLFLMPFSGLAFLEICIICGSILLFPKHWFLFNRETAQGMLCLEVAGNTGKTRKEDTRKLYQVAAVFDKMADTLATSPEENSLFTIVQDAASDVCARCELKRSCWKNVAQRKSALVSLSKQIIGNDGSACPFWTCPKSRELVRALFNRLNQNRELAEDELKQNEWRELLQEQFKDAGMAVKEMARITAENEKTQPDVVSRITEALAAKRIHVKSIELRKRKEPVVSGQWEEVTTKERLPVRDHRIVIRLPRMPDAVIQKMILRCVNEACGCPMEIDPRGSRGLFFTPRLLRCDGAALSCPAPSQPVCGDDYALFIAGNKRIVCISDGMGNGSNANTQSNAVITLIRTFLEAGYDSGAMIRAINTLLLMRGSETFATLDLCLIDVHTKQAEFIKAGAAPSFLVRRGSVREIIGPSLPVGILREMKPVAVSCMIEPGDMIVMASDGVTDALGQSFADCLEEQCCGAQETVKELLAKARQTMSGAKGFSKNAQQPEMDDMTVIAVALY